MKKIIQSISIGLALVVATQTVSVKKAEAGVIIGVATAGVGGALVGLTLSAAGFFWGIQSDDLNWKAGALFILNEEVEANNISQQLSSKYPELETYLADEIAQLVIKNSNLVKLNQDGIKEVVIPENELAEVLEIAEAINPNLAQKLKNDLTVSSRL